jgi:phosphatidylethanolamine/phosphatidyl-N-methylethanolamine N-methyltransferase
MMDDVFKRLKPKGGAAAVLDEESIVAAYARWAPIYDAFFGVVTWFGRKAAQRAVNNLPPGRLLEAGVGTGISLPGYRSTHRITGIDLSPDMLERAERRVERRRLNNVEALRVMDAGNLTMPDGSFDSIVAMYVMTVVPDPDKVLDEFARVVRPGGKLVLVNHFAAENGQSAKASIEKALARFSAKLGWDPDFPLHRITSHSRWKLVEKKSLQPFGLFKLLVFERC